MLEIRDLFILGAKCLINTFTLNHIFKNNREIEGHAFTKPRLVDALKVRQNLRIILAKPYFNSITYMYTINYFLVKAFYFFMFKL